MLLSKLEELLLVSRTDQYNAFKDHTDKLKIIVGYNRVAARSFDGSSQ